MFAPKLFLLFFGLLIVAAQSSYSEPKPTKHPHHAHHHEHHHEHKHRHHEHHHEHKHRHHEHHHENKHRHHEHHHEHKHKPKHEQFISFQTFLGEVERATFEQYKHTAVLDEAAFNEIKLHILDTYEGVGEVTSFILENEYADCIDILRQPSLRQLGIREIAEPPKHGKQSETSECQSPGTFTYAESPLRLGLKDQFENPISCPKHAFPMSRLTLEKLTRYATLQDFFSKPAPSAEIHLHAQAMQSVTNYGGNSWLNLWNPTGDFSISQHWYVGQSEGTPVQTVEGGWVVNRLSHADSGLSRLFIYFTADGYNKTGCWNNDCKMFTQINHNWYLDGPWDHYSTSGGEQWGFELQWKLYETNWWLFIKGPGDYEAVGYYSTSIFNGGQLSESSTAVIYGGEVANYTGGQNFPQMGSAALAEKGYAEAAFQNTIFYIPKNENGGVGVWADLTTFDQGTPACYTIDLTEWENGGNWGTYFYFGGPGGFNCIP